GVGVHRLDPIAFDAALLDEVVDHDLGAERMQLGPAAGEWARVVVDDADLELLALSGSLRGERRADHERCDDHGAHEASQSMVEHEISSPGRPGLGIRLCGPLLVARAMFVKIAITLKTSVTEKEVGASKLVLPTTPERRPRDRTSAPRVCRGIAGAVPPR